MSRAIASKLENKLHCCLDVTFKEDACRTRIENAAENLNIIRKITMNLLQQETSTKPSIPKNAIWQPYTQSIWQRFLVCSQLI